MARFGWALILNAAEHSSVNIKGKIWHYTASQYGISGRTIVPSVRSCGKISYYQRNNHSLLVVSSALHSSAAECTEDLRSSLAGQRSSETSTACRSTRASKCVAFFRVHTPLLLGCPRCCSWCYWSVHSDGFCSCLFLWVVARSTRPFSLLGGPGVEQFFPFPFSFLLLQLSSPGLMQRGFLQQRIRRDHTGAVL